MIMLQQLLFMPLFGEGTGDCSLHKKETKALHRSFGESAAIDHVQIPAEQGSLLELIYPEDCLYTIQVAGETKGYLFSTRAMGRYDAFDYSVIYSQDLAVLEVIVTVYRSTHGAAISQKRWLAQFAGYNGGELTLGSDIDGVTGGTLSATSIVKDMQRCHLFMTNWKSQ